MMAWNTLFENKEACFEKCKKQMESGYLLKAYRTKEFMKYMSLITEFNIDFMLKTLDHISVFESGMLTMVFLYGIEVKLK